MRLKEVALGLALSVVLAGTANAGSWRIGLNGGAGFPTGDYGDFANTGWNLGAMATNQVNDIWGLGVDLGYHAWGGPENTAGDKLSWRAIQATAHAIANFPVQSPRKPYLKAGFGLYNVGSKLETASTDITASESKLGFNVGAGIDFPTSTNKRWGIGGAYHIISAQDDLGSDLNFFTVGVNVSWGVGH
jgi:opacity protein-like surface antigen